MNRKLIESAYHRNGVSGNGFWAHVFIDDDGSRKVAIDFGDIGQCPVAVLDIDILAKSGVAFGVNSWRGDNYADDSRRWTEEARSKI